MTAISRRLPWLFSLALIFTFLTLCVSFGLQKGGSLLSIAERAALTMTYPVQKGIDLAFSTTGKVFDNYINLIAIESSFFSNLGISAALTPDLNLVLIIFLTSCPPGIRCLLSAIGISITTSLFSSDPSIMQPLGHLFIFLIGCRLNQTIFMNNIFPQAVFAGIGKLLLAVFLSLAAASALSFSNIIFRALGGAVTTTIFAFPILHYLNTLQKRFSPVNSNSIFS